MKKILYLTLIGLMLSLSFGVSSVGSDSIKTNSSGNIFYVGGGGPGNYSKIEEAINASLDGDTIIVYPGAYYENFKINKSINLIGKDKNDTIICGQGGLYMHLVSIVSDNVIVSGFTFSRPDFPPLWSEIWTAIDIASDQVKIFNNNFIDFYGGIACYNAKNCEIYNNFMSNSSLYGILLDEYNTDESLVNPTPGFKIKENVFNEIDMAIIILKNENILLSHNKISNCDKGILIEKSSDNTISNNEFYNNNNSLIIKESENNIIKNNLFSSNHSKVIGEAIIISEKSNNNYIIFNEISDFKKGIKITDKSNGNIVKYSNLINITELGINIIDSHQNNIKKNNFINCTKAATLINSFFTKWSNNFWNKELKYPKIILGKLGLNGAIPWINMDRNPAKKPYTI